MAQYWKSLLQESAEYDAEQITRQKRIKSGLKNHKIVGVTMTVQDSPDRGACGFCYSEYELPFEEKQMKSDIREWSEYKGGKYVVNVEKTEIKCPTPPADKEEQDPHWPPSEVIDRDLAIRLDTANAEPECGKPQPAESTSKSESNIWMRLATWYWQNIQQLTKEALQQGLIANEHEYPRAIVYLKDNDVSYTLFHPSFLFNNKLDSVHGKNMGLPCMIMP